jgi:hypothetical protein
MAVRRLALSSCAWLLLAMAACAAPSSQSPAVPADLQAQTTDAGAPQAVPDTPEPAAADAQDSAATTPTRDLDKLRKLKVRTGGPLPPRVLPAPPEPDRSCRTDADCAVKNVGNCCGEYPACVNKDSPVDPAAVRAQCARQGTMSACGFREISGCSCVQGSCTELVQAIDPSVDPAPRPPEER